MSNVYIDGYGDLEKILKHYDAIPILLRYIQNQPEKVKVLLDWDIARSDPRKKIDVTMVIRSEE